MPPDACRLSGSTEQVSVISRRNQCRTISLGHCGDVLQLVPALFLVVRGMATIKVQTQYN
jgi:hypothetical protein